MVAVGTLSADGSRDISINDSHRSGRPQKADAAAQKYMFWKLLEYTSAADTAAKTQQAIGLKISASAMTCLLRRMGLHHLTAKLVPMLTASQKLARVTFAKADLRRENCLWLRVLVTNSKYFRLHSKGRPAGRWCTPATRGVVARPNHSIAAQVYMDISCHGVTCHGIAPHEYMGVLHDFFIPQGNKVFQDAGKWDDNWQMQQDNAPFHKIATNMDFITANVPGGNFLAWPSTSRDMFPIENFWGWMDSRLHKLHKCRNIEETHSKLSSPPQWQTFPPSLLHNLFNEILSTGQPYF